jgi:hypothetical protein
MRVEGDTVGSRWFAGANGWKTIYLRPFGGRTQGNAHCRRALSSESKAAFWRLPGRASGRAVGVADGYWKFTWGVVHPPMRWGMVNE